MSAVEAALQTSNTRPPINGEFEGKSLITVDQLSREDIVQVVDLAASMEVLHSRKPRSMPPLLSGNVVKAVMFENSSRTAGTYTSAAAYLGAHAERPALEASSMSKGETALETVRCFAGQSDSLLVRHADENFMDLVARTIKKPFTNGGNGSADHPTQFLKDAFTFAKNYQTLDGLKVVLLGDVAHNRPARTLLRGLAKFEGTEVTIAAPDYLAMPKEIVAEARNSGVKVTEVTSARDVLTEPAIFYLSRPREEKLRKIGGEELYNQVVDDYERYGYNFSANNWSKAHPEAHAYHALPYKTEIDEGFHGDSRNRYHEQEDNGIFTHMASLALQLAQSKVVSQMEKGLIPSVSYLTPRPELTVVA